MEFRFSRHAKRRAKLYDIEESSVLEILSEGEFSTGLHEIIREVRYFIAAGCVFQFGVTS